MYPAHIINAKETRAGTVLTVLLPSESKADEFLRLKGESNYLGGSIHFDDGRSLSGKQQRAIFALIRDISEHLGYEAEQARMLYQLWFCILYDIDSFSLSHHNYDCASMTVARHFITFLLEFCMEHEVPLSEKALKLTDDTDKYLYLCIKYEKCAICGKHGEIHHVDAIGMGHDRKQVDDSRHKKICLCREHHSEAHTLGVKGFNKKYHVYGIIYKPKEAVNEQGDTNGQTDERP